MEDEGVIKIALVDDHPVMREGLIKVITVDKQITVTMEAFNGLDMLQQLEKNTDRPDIAIIDVSMPVMDGLVLSEELKSKYPEIKILVLSAYCSDYNVAVMINNGACGYLLKDCAPSELKKAIHDIYEKGRHYSELASEHVFKMLHRNSYRSLNIPDREMEFLKLCCTDLRYDQIAEQMGITMSSLHSCRERLFDRLNITSRIALILFAVQAGIVLNSSHQHHNLKIKF